MEYHRRQILDSADLLEDVIRTRVRLQQDLLEAHNKHVNSQKEGGSWSSFFLRNIVSLRQEREAILTELSRWEQLLIRILTAKRAARRQ